MKDMGKELLPYIIIIVCVILIRTFLITPVRVKGTSMVPTLKDREIMLLNKWDRSYERFDIVVLNYNKSKLIKRVIGVPGEHIKYKDNKLYINGKYVKEPFQHAKTDDFLLEEVGYDRIPKGYYLVLGDNRGNSVDGRTFGLVLKKDILGTTRFTLFPFQRFGFVK